MSANKLPLWSRTRCSFRCVSRSAVPDGGGRKTRPWSIQSSNNPAVLACTRLLNTRSQLRVGRKATDPVRAFLVSRSLVSPTSLSRNSSYVSSLERRNARTMMSSVQNNLAPTKEVDILIVGGGVVGCSLAYLIASRCPSLSVAVVEANKRMSRAQPVLFDKTRTNNKNTQQESPPRGPVGIPHPRSYALSPHSLQLLYQLVPDLLLQEPSSNQNRIGYYTSMQIWEQNQPASLLFTQQDVDDAGVASNNSNLQQKNDRSVPPPGHPYLSSVLGGVVEESILVNSLWSQLETLPNCELISETTVLNLYLPNIVQTPLPAEIVTVNLRTTVVNADAKTANGPNPVDDVHQISARLVVAADGANSRIRKMLEVPYMNYEYGQAALTFTVQLDLNQYKPVKGRAYQRFLSTGPLALLPTYSPQHAIVVWSTTPEQIQKWKDHPQLAAHINELLQQGPEQLQSLWTKSTVNESPSLWDHLQYGVDRVIETVQYGPALAAMTPQDGSNKSTYCAPPIIATIVSPQYMFPLSCGQVSKYNTPDGHVVLVGDAAHTVHPMAGQGVNIGLSDVDDLVQVLCKAYQGGIPLHTMLKAGEYQYRRQVAVTSTLAGIHLLHGVFNLQSKWAKQIKSLGMNAIQHMSPLRRALVQVAVSPK